MEARLNEAFQGLGIEGLFFTASTGLLFLISATIWFAISKSPPAPHLLLSLYLGVGLIGVQYSISVATRYLLADTLWFESILWSVPLAGPVICAAILGYRTSRIAVCPDPGTLH